jgi:hypothetical protein
MQLGRSCVASRNKEHGFKCHAGASLLAGNGCLASENAASGVCYNMSKSVLVMGAMSRSLSNGKSAWLALYGGHMRVGDGSSAHGNGDAGFQAWGSGARLEAGRWCTSIGNKGGDWSHSHGGELVREVLWSDLPAVPSWDCSHSR